MPVDISVLSQLNLATFHDWQIIVGEDVVQDLFSFGEDENNPLAHLEEHLALDNVVVLKLPSQKKTGPLAIAVREQLLPLPDNREDVSVRYLILLRVNKRTGDESFCII